MSKLRTVTHSVKGRKLSYQGEAFICDEYRLAGRLGLRLWARRNVATGNLDYRVIKGDGRTTNFSLFEYHTNADQRMIDAAIARMESGHYDHAPVLDRTLDR